MARIRTWIFLASCSYTFYSPTTTSLMVLNYFSHIKAISPLINLAIKAPLFPDTQVIWLLLQLLVLLLTLSGGRRDAISIPTPCATPNWEHQASWFIPPPFPPPPCLETGAAFARLKGFHLGGKWLFTCSPLLLKRSALLPNIVN